jgi:hypothetical protein
MERYRRQRHLSLIFERYKKLETLVLEQNLARTEISNKRGTKNENYMRIQIT